CKTRVLIPATTLDRFGHRLFSSSEVGDRDLSLVDVAMASAAAPTYFSPIRPEGEQRTYVDGGLWANTPSLVAVVRAYLDTGVSLEDIRLISIANGTFPTGRIARDFARRRPISPHVITSVFDIIYACQASSADHL